MYFQNLKSMMDSNGTNHIDQKLIEQFDFWLASRRTSVKNYLCPHSFSMYSGIDPGLSLGLFKAVSELDEKFLRARYDIFIRDKGIKIDSVYDQKEIPGSYDDPDTGKTYKINLSEDIRVYFELLEEPIEKPSITTNDSGKSRGVGLTEYNKTNQSFSIGRRLDENNH